MVFIYASNACSYTSAIRNISLYYIYLCIYIIYGNCTNEFIFCV